MLTALAGAGSETIGDAIAIAGLPDMVRGYEDLKLRRIAEYRQTLAEALAAFRAASSTQG